MISFALILLTSNAAAMADETLTTIQSQTALVAEMSLSGRVNDCLMRSYCLVGAHSSKSGSIAMGIEESYHILSRVLDTVDNPEDLVNIGKLKTSYEVGSNMEDSSICHQLFRCNLEENFELKPANRNFLPECENIGAVCPGAGISCALCGLFLPPACSNVCPMAALFCGASGYLCMLQA